MRVIGTAGHVDHGKSTLIAALTGTHPDRLKEEQEREMTIELGFGWMTLPDDEEIGIVDVPGHRDFIENMLAGIAGIDAAMLVVAADEGVMPQTREHLAILELLRIPSGLIALTKTDLVSDPEWLDLVEADIRALTAGTMLQDAPIIRVSAKTRSGLDVLQENLSVMLQHSAPRPDLGRPRLPVDRVFSMSGFGTVVTGTLSDGQLALGDEVMLLPSGLKGRIRGLQTHKKKEDRAVPGSRTAVNISGISTDEIDRGDVLTHPGQYQVTRRFDAHLQLLGDLSAPLKHALEVKVFIGASERMAKIRILGTETLGSADQGWIQLETREPVLAVRGDRFIIRRPSPGETLGGGVVIDHQPKGRHKRFDQEVLRSLASLARGSPDDIVLETAVALQVASLKEIIARSRLEAEPALQALQQLVQAGTLTLIEEGELSISSDLLAMATSQWNAVRKRVLDLVDSYHSRHPLKRGIPREELKSKLRMPGRAFPAIIRKLLLQNALIEVGNMIAVTGHAVKLTGDQQASVRELMRRFEASPSAPPSIKECQAAVGPDVVGALVELGDLVQLSTEVVFRKGDYERMVDEVKNFIAEKGEITVADARDLFGSSRKYMLALLEHLDSAGITVREGDVRKLHR